MLSLLVATQWRIKPKGGKDQSMAGKIGHFGNVIAGKFNYLEGNFDPLQVLIIDKFIMFVNQTQVQAY